MATVNAAKVSEPEIFCELAAIIAKDKDVPDGNGQYNGLWISESTPLTGAPPKATCGYGAGNLGRLAGLVNSNFPLSPTLSGNDLSVLNNVGDLANLICKNYD